MASGHTSTRLPQVPVDGKWISDGFLTADQWSIVDAEKGQISAGHGISDGMCPECAAVMNSHTENERKADDNRTE